MTHLSVADRIVRALHTPGGSPLRVRCWDGSEAGPPDAPVLVVRNPEALRHVLWAPSDLGLGRAFVAGDLDLEGDILDALERLEGVLAPEVEASGGARARAGYELLRAGGIGLRPKLPAEESRLAGRLHSKQRDSAAIRHHYDVGNDFYRLVLGPSMVYSCAHWVRDDPSYTLEDAQRDKLELVCRKLDLRPGMRMLDVGCGWGSMVIHAAREHGVKAVGITLSPEQAELARKRVAEAGLDAAVEIRLQDYRDVTDGPFDAISSIGMAEHVGADAYEEYAGALFRLLRPEGRLLNHQIMRRPGKTPRRRTFISAFVFPDGELQPLGAVVGTLERAGFEVRDVESLREHYGRTLRRWVANLESNWDECVRLTSPGRARVWRVYMAGSALSFEAGRIGVDQVLAVRPDRGRSGMPAVRPRYAPAE